MEESEEEEFERRKTKRPKEIVEKSNGEDWDEFQKWKRRIQRERDQQSETIQRKEMDTKSSRPKDKSGVQKL